MRNLLLIVCLICASTSLSGADPRHRTVKGQIVAYSEDFNGCVNGNTYWSMLIHLQRSKDVHSEFTEVRFTQPCEKSPEWLFLKQSIQKFRLARQKDCDSMLIEFLPLIDRNTGLQATYRIPIWRYPSDTKHEGLPFGQVVPCYRSIDLPYMPIL